MRVITFGNVLIVLAIVLLYHGFLHFQSYLNGTPYLPQTTINEYYSRSNAGIYYQGDLILNADPKSFKPLSVPFYGKDQSRVFWGEREITLAHSPSFEMINDSYSKDQERVYFRGYPILQADPKTFTSIKHSHRFTEEIYAKDQSNVYIERYIIPHADPATFELFNWDWAKDKNYVFYKGRHLPEIDVKSFEPIHYIAKDRNHPYDQGNFISGIDGETFEEIPSSFFYRDKNYVYSSDNVKYIFYGKDKKPIAPKDFIYVENIDPETGRDYSYYRAPGNICYDSSNGERVRCEEEQ